MTEATSTEQGDATHLGHEPDVVSVRILLMSGAGLVLLVAFALALIYGTNRFLTSQESTSQRAPGMEPIRTAAGPQFTSDQSQLLRELRQTEQQRLDNYEWIDEPAGVARIPIDRAMDILAKQGLPALEPGSEEPDENKVE